MTFDANDAGADIDGIRRGFVPGGQIDAAASSFAVTAGEDAA
jgi:hypothetical protein